MSDPTKPRPTKKCEAILNWSFAEFKRSFALDVTTYGKKEGYGVFIALATFAVAESTALTVIAKGEGRQWIVLLIYSIIVVLTAFWIRSMLTAKQVEKKVWPPHDVISSAFDRPSLLYGRWTLGWTLGLGVLMFFLAINQLLPNQTHRAPYKLTDGPIKCKSRFLTNVARDLETGQDVDMQLKRLRDKWITWLSQVPGTSTRSLIWIESTPFDNFYRDIDVELKAMKDEQNYNITELVAFLVTPRESPETFTYRQLEFRVKATTNTAIEQTNSLRLLEPNKGDYVVILANTGYSKQEPSVTDLEHTFGLNVLRSR